MKRRLAGVFFGLVAASLIGLAGCRLMQSSDEKPDPGTLPELTTTRLDYVDTDGFDALLENALVNQDPIIVVRTGRTKPDWTARLNAWIAAWNQTASRPRTVRGQSALPGVSLNKDTVRELRLLIGDLLGRIEDAAQAGSTWWADQRQRNRRIALMKPYSLRFHMDQEDLIQMILFHGSYAAYYPRFMQSLMESRLSRDTEWQREVECSTCAYSKSREVERD